MSVMFFFVFSRKNLISIEEKNRNFRQINQSQPLENDKILKTTCLSTAEFFVCSSE
jgi:hypothetical protein